ncbi:MAG: DUF2723 domain-containing protein, partial [Caldilineales bacterium]|nr:DUF2723 domain-containing protein [Caldilineales bacterium]
MRPRSLFPAFLLGLFAFGAYWLTAAPAVLPGDAGEFQFTVPLAGVSHPPGYPLYHLLGWLWTRLYPANPAQGVNHFSALWGGVAVGLFYLLAYEALSQLAFRLRWGRGVGWLAAITTVAWGANPVLWAQATQAEVYTLQTAFVAALLGAGPIAEAFVVAFRFPNLFRRWFGEGAFNAAFVPLFTKRLSA